jgi:hypothetical protein
MKELAASMPLQIRNLALTGPLIKPIQVINQTDIEIILNLKNGIRTLLAMPNAVDANLDAFRDSLSAIIWLCDSPLKDRESFPSNAIPLILVTCTQLKLSFHFRKHDLLSETPSMKELRSNVTPLTSPATLHEFAVSIQFTSICAHAVRGQERE